MGSTIHYGLTTDLVDIESIRITVQRIRQLAWRLPFQKVGAIIECQDQECTHNREDPLRVLKIQAAQYVKDGDYYITVAPLHFVAFTIVPGPGSEPANIGLARYPEIIDVEELDKQVQTHLTGWRWKSSCTANALDGVANFVRCHASVISLLDAVQIRNLARLYVNDETRFWNYRSFRKLASSVGEWDETVAEIANRFRHLRHSESLDASFHRFEHLEGNDPNTLEQHVIHPPHSPRR